MLTRNSAVARWGPPLLWMLAIFVVSATPGAQLPQFGTLDYFVKKAGHMLAYAVLAALLHRGLGHRQGQWAWAWLLAVAYALLDEFHQSFVPGRHPSLIDVFLFDGVGAVIGLAARRALLHGGKHPPSAAGRAE